MRIYLLMFFSSAFSLFSQNQKYLESGASVSRIGEFFEYHYKQKAYKYANPSFSISGGIVIRKWDFGIGVSCHTIYTVYDYENWRNFNQLTSEMQFISLPLSVKYAFVNRKKSKLSLTSTLCNWSNYIVKEHFSLTFTDTTQPLEGPSIVDMRLVCSLGLEYEKKINSNFSLEIGTSLKYVNQDIIYSKYPMPEDEFRIDAFFPSLSFAMKYYLNKKK